MTATATEPEVVPAEGPTSPGQAAAPAGTRDPRALLRSLVLVGAAPVCDVLALVALLLVQVDRVAALVLAAASLLLLLLVPRTTRRLLRGIGPTGRGVLPRAALVIVAAVQHPVSPAWLAAAIVCLALVLEPAALRLHRAAVPIAANLPGLRARNAGPAALGRLFVLNTAVTLGVVGTDLTEAGLAVAVGAAATAVVVTVAFCADAAVRIRRRRTGDAALTRALTAYGPRFALHWDATPGTEYQVTMWLPHLQRIGVPFVVVVRNPLAFASIAAATTAPVLLRRDPGDIDAVVVPSLSTVFYVNNAARNTHFVRFPGLEHVQLGHGDSDKAPSYSPVHRLYTRVFVSGRAAVERFAQHGVQVPQELFTVVGRPQVGGMLVGASTSDAPTALYAPTWAGTNTDTNHSSLPIGVRIVEALLEQGYRVLFRPHPYTRRSPALAAEAARIDALLAHDARRTHRAHLDSGAAAALDLVASFDAADLLVSDVSSIASDFLQSEKPFLITAVADDPGTLLRESSIAAGGYVVPRDGQGLDRAIALAGGADPLLADRRAIKAHVLGDHGGQDPAEAFVQHARRVVLGAVPAAADEHR